MLIAQLHLQLAIQRLCLLVALFDHGGRDGVARVIIRVPLSPQRIEYAPVLVSYCCQSALRFITPHSMRWPVSQP